jgi:NADH dehydrogenase
MKKDSVNILIIGGGFAGVECARVLSAHSGVTVTLISPDHHMEYYPAAFRVFESNQVDLAQIPLVDIVPDSVRVVVDVVGRIDSANHSVTCASGKSYTGDYIVIAAGSQSAYYNIPGVSEYAFPFRGSKDVLRIRTHIDSIFDKCAHSSPEEQLIAFRFVVVGGGPAGCEIAAGIAHYAHTRARQLSIPHDVVSVVLLEGRDRILSMFSEDFSEVVSHKLRELGVQILPYRRLMENKPWSAILQDVQMGTRTVVWTAGVEVATLVQGLELPKSKKGRILVGDNLVVSGSDMLYAVGDVAETERSGLAQVAVYDGAFVARDILARIDNVSRVRYSPPSVSHIVPLNRWSGVVSIGGVVLSGWVGWVARAAADMLYLASRIGIIKTLHRMVKSL